MDEKTKVDMLHFVHECNGCSTLLGLIAEILHKLFVVFHKKRDHSNGHCFCVRASKLRNKISLSPIHPGQPENFQYQKI